MRILILAAALGGLLHAGTALAQDASNGKLAYYGSKFAGHKTASGEPFDPNAMTMAHKTLPFGTRVRVTNLKNKHSVVLRVNDRGPSQGDRVGDVSLAAARKLGMTHGGTAEASLQVVGSGKGPKAARATKTHKAKAAA